MQCFVCHILLNDEAQYYILSEIGSEISSIVSRNLNSEIDNSSLLCEDCFTTAANQLSSESRAVSQDQCVWCLKSIVNRHSHSLPNGPERDDIARRILPRQIQPANKVCYACWLAAHRNVQRAQQQELIRTAPPAHQHFTSNTPPSPSQPGPSTSQPVPSTSQPVPSTSQPVPSTPQPVPSTSQPVPSTSQPVLSTPQPVPSTSQPVPSTSQPVPSTSQPVPSTPQPVPSTSQPVPSTSQPLPSSQPVPSTSQPQLLTSQPEDISYDPRCVWCQASLARRHSHSLPEGPERDYVAQRISPRLITPHSRVCYACWLSVRRNSQIVVEQVADASTYDENNVLLTTLHNFRRTSNSQRTCFVHGCNNVERHNVPNFLRYRILKSNQLYVTENARICSYHLGVYDWGFLNDYGYISQFTTSQLEAVISLALTNEEINKFNFEQLDIMSDEQCHYWTGTTKENFMLIINEATLLREQFKKYKTALAIFLVKLRTGESHARLGQLFEMSKVSISKTLTKVRNILNEQFVPLHMGIGHLPRDEIINHNLIIPQGLFGGEEGGSRKAIVICDGTYTYLQKSSNYLFQKQSYSLHKYRNLVKPFLIVTTDGHILDIYGPYAATVSDAEIMSQLFRHESNELRQYFRRGDVFILDRGFRDAIPLLTSLNYNVYKPESLESGETQLPTLRANKSRLVTMCRWVVEVVNGRFKRDFKLIRHDFSNNAATHLIIDFRIAGAMINAFHVPITDRPDAPLLLERALQKLHQPNVLADFIIENNINRRRASFANINADILIDEFPVMTESDLILFALGTYQIKQARSYYGEHIRQNGVFEIEVCSDVEGFHIPDLENELFLFRGRIQSRHRSGRAYYTYILLNMQESNWERRIHGYYCNCIIGKRTVGCCAHIMTIVWYMGWARHQQHNITAPASFLDDILVREDFEIE